MKNFNSIKKNKDFQTVYQQGKSYANRLLVMYVMRKQDLNTEDDGKKQDRHKTRIGISVSKKVGNSVVRHHITRLIRESFRLHEDMIETDLDIVVVARAAAKEQDYKSIESAYLHLCGLHNILKKESK
jgi:ribonuclease P protein component